MNSLLLLLVTFAAGMVGTLAKVSMKGLFMNPNDNPLPVFRCLRELNPIDCYHAKEHADIAQAITTTYLLIRKTNGEASTFKHCYWTAYMARKMDY